MVAAWNSRTGTDMRRNDNLRPRSGSTATDRNVTSASDPESQPSVDDELAQLVDAARQGSESAFRQLVEATYRDMFTLAIRLTGDEEDARDVTQEAYLRAHRSLGGFRGDARFSTWMYRITANCAATYVQRRARHRHDQLFDDMAIVDTSYDSDPEYHSSVSDLRGRLNSAIASLPPKLRSVVVLRDIYELPHEAIAQELGISVTAAKVRLHRARHRLRAEVFPTMEEVESRAV